MVGVESGLLAQSRVDGTGSEQDGACDIGRATGMARTPISAER